MFLVEYVPFIRGFEIVHKMSLAQYVLNTCIIIYLSKFGFQFFFICPKMLPTTACDNFIHIILWNIVLSF